MVGAVAVVTWLWVLTHHVNGAAVSSDGATVMLEADAVLHGNLVLHGWWLSLDSWWTLDVVVFAAAMGVVVSYPALLLVVPALVAGLAVVAGVVLARRGQRGAPAWAGSLLVVGVLAFPGHPLATQFLASPWHQTTILYALAAFIALRRGRFGLGWALAVVLLGAGMLGDLMMVAYGTVPVALGGVVAILRRRSLRAGAAPLTAAALATAGAYLVRVLTAALGAYRLGPTNPRAGVTEALHNLHLLVTLALPGMWGVRSVSGLGSGGAGPAIHAAHLVGFCAVAAGFLFALWSLLRGALAGRVPGESAVAGGATGGAGRAGAESGTARSSEGIGRAGTEGGWAAGTRRRAAGARSVRPPAGEAEPWRLDDILVIAAFGPALSYVVLALTPSPAYFRYLTATVVFATIAAGRMLTRWWSQTPAATWRRAAEVVAGVTLAGFVAGSGLQLARPAATSPEPTLVSFLRSRHLSVGVGDYWAASITTVETRGAIRVRPVVADPSGQLEAYNKGPVRSWFAGVGFQFLVFHGNGGYGGVDLPHAEKTWGPPAHVYSVDHGAYTVLTWSHLVHVTRYAPRR